MRDKKIDYLLSIEELLGTYKIEGDQINEDEVLIDELSEDELDELVRAAKRMIEGLKTL